MLGFLGGDDKAEVTWGDSVFVILSHLILHSLPVRHGVFFRSLTR
jgi:hypothetical protein